VVSWLELLQSSCMQSKLIIIFNINPIFFSFLHFVHSASTCWRWQSSFYTLVLVFWSAIVATWNVHFWKKKVKFTGMQLLWFTPVFTIQTTFWLVVNRIFISHCYKISWLRSGHLAICCLCGALEHISPKFHCLGIVPHWKVIPKGWTCWSYLYL